MRAMEAIKCALAASTFKETQIGEEFIVEFRDLNLPSKIAKEEGSKNLCTFLPKINVVCQTNFRMFQSGRPLLPTFGSICRCYFPNLPQFVAVVDLR